MKRFFIILLLALSGMNVSAQEVTTAWPYLYPEFTQGTVYMAGGKKISKKLNVHVRADALHYLDKDIIKEASTLDVLYVEIGTDSYMVNGPSLLKVIAKNGKAAVCASILGNYDALRETGGAYGVSSTTSATRKLTSIDQDSQLGQNHMLIWQSRHEGQTLELITKYYFVTSDFVVEANKKSIGEIVPEARKAEWKAWLKSHKIKWNNPEQVLTVAEFFDE